MEKISKITTIFLWVIFGISVILAISFGANISSNEQDPSMLSWLNTNIIWMYILLIFSLVLLVGFGVIQLVSNFKDSKKGMLSIIVMGVIVLIAYMLSSDAIPVFLGSEKFVEQGILTPSVSKWVDTGLYTTYVFFAISIGAIGYSSVTRLFK